MICYAWNQALIFKWPLSSAVGGGSVILTVRVCKEWLTDENKDPNFSSWDGGLVAAGLFCRPKSDGPHSGPHVE